MHFATSLEAYPKDHETLFYAAGEQNSYAYFSMKFYCLDGAGHIGVQINLEENVATVYRSEEKDKITLEIKVEPASIDKFRKALTTLAKNEDGQAILYGRN